MKSELQTRISAMTRDQIRTINGSLTFGIPAASWPMPQINPAYLLDVQPARVQVITLRRHSFGGN